MLNYEVLVPAVIIIAAVITAWALIRYRRLAAELETVTRRERHLLRLTDGLPTSVFQFKQTPDGQIVRTFMNQAARRLVRVDNPLPTRRRSRFFEFVHPDDTKALRSSIDNSLASGEPIGATFRFKFPDGDWGWVFAESSVHVDEEGASVWSGYMHDLTGERSANEALNRALVSKNKLVAAISGELRLPAREVREKLQSLRKTNLNLIQLEMVDSVISGLSETERQTRDLIDLTRLETRDLVIVDRNFDLRQMISAVSSDIETAARAKSVSFMTEIDESVPTYVRCDGDRLRQILDSLLANSVKYTDSGYVRLSVQLEAVRSAESPTASDNGLARAGVAQRVRLRFVVRDSGIGIPAASLEGIFEPPEGGFGRDRRGIRLVICQRLCALMGGRITARSKVTVGTTFEVAIPAVIAEAADRYEPWSEDHAADDTGARLAEATRDNVNGESPTILIVDDNRLARVMVSTLLADSGFTVHQAQDKEEALELIAQTDYRAVITDYRMPDANGVELGMEIRDRGAAGKPVPVLMLLTAGVTDTEREQAKTVFDAVLEKPVSTVELVKTLHTIERTGTKVV